MMHVQPPLVLVQGGEPKIALNLYNRQQSQLVPHPVYGLETPTQHNTYMYMHVMQL